MGSIPGPTHRMGHVGHLLFQFTVCCIARRVCDVVRGTGDMADLVVAQSARISRLRGVVSRRGRLVAVHFSLS